MKIAMVTSEANPLIKTGGLADVVYSLSQELAKVKQEVIIVMPFYRVLSPKLTKKPRKVEEFYIDMSWRRQLCQVYKTKIENVNYYLLKNDQYFGRDNVYGYLDDMERFAFFTLASKKLLESLPIVPDVIHLHDWHPGMLPVLLKDDVKSPLHNAKTILTIHNPAFKGYMDKYFLGNFYNLNDKYYDDGSVRFNGQVSTLKAAIMYCHKITTVSPTHKEELLYQNISDGLESVLKFRQDDFIGILNGIDYQEFDPSHDVKITKMYSDDFIKGKAQNKIQLEKDLDLNIDDKPLFGMVSRLTWQKGLDILLPCLRFILSRGDKVVILGSGEWKYEQELEKLHLEYPHQLAIYIGYNDNLAHQIYAASDFFLMPSLFEPCGLSQMISLKYATLPVVRLVGGLKDSVIPYMDGNLEVANGFGFYEFSIDALKDTLLWCEQIYYKPEQMKKLQQNALIANNDWHNSCLKYLELYKSIEEK